MRACLLLATLILALAACRAGERPAPTLILWAWERPEDLRFAPAEAEIAVQTGFVDIAGASFAAHGRRYPMLTSHPPATALVHVQIDPAQPVQWTPALRQRVAAAVLHYAAVFPARRVQLDFEVRASDRQILLDLLADLRRGLPRGTILSMTALASWCDGETWLDAAPVDEIVPMLFRMRGGETLKNRLAAGGDFRNPRCRAALGVASDAAIERAPPGRRVYLFSPANWTAADYERVRTEVEGWR
jgi:hypothetical protein